MVKKVSKMVKDQPIHTSIKHNYITISLEVWDFNFTRAESFGHYVYDNIVIKNEKLDEKNKIIKEKLIKEIISKYGVTISL